MEPQARNFGFTDLIENEVAPEETAQLLDLEREERDLGTLDGQKVPGTGEDVSLRLSEDHEKALARELCDLLLNHDQMMTERWERDKKVEDAYALMVDTTRTGTYPGAAMMASEMTMSAVDQANARISSAILNTAPIMEVNPIESSTFRGDMAVEVAGAAEDFLENYSRDVIKIEDLIPMITLRCTKIGTAVSYITWKDDKQEYKAYNRKGKIEKVKRDRSRITATLLRNQDVVFWPPWVHDWQDDYEVVGHRSQLTISQFRLKAKELGLDEDCQEEIEKFSANAALSEDRNRALEREGIDGSVAQQEKGLVQLTELWCYRLLPDGEMPVRFQVFLHEGLRKLLWIDYNRFHSQKHPYFPTRYKKVDGSAWGTGLGHEIAYCQAADDAFRNLELDNLMSLAFVIMGLKAGTTADALMDRPYPGMRVATEDPSGDIVPISMAPAGSGALELLYTAIGANNQRKTDASGLASVLAGQGDPTMKSGAGTGSTMALIEQAGKKFGHVDQSIRSDLTPMFAFFLDLIAQFAAEGVLYTKTSDENAQTLSMLKFIPLQGNVSDNFRIRAHSASAAQNKEMTKQNMLVAHNFILQQVQSMLPLAQQYFQATNPEGLNAYMKDWLDTLEYLGDKILEHQEVPGLKDILPTVEDPTPQDQKINELQQQLQQATAQLQQIQQQAAMAQQPPQAAPTGGGMPPEAMPPEQQQMMPGMA